MNKALIVPLVGLLLIGCEEKEVARKRNEDLLPAGCRIIDLDYGDLRAAVICEGRKTTTSVRSWDETVMVNQYQPNGSFIMVPQVTHHSRISAEIESP